MTKERKFKEIDSANLWLAENKDDSIEGEVVSIDTDQFDKKQHTLKAPSGEEFAIPSYTVLVTKLKNIAVGDYVKITYLGELKSKKGALYKDFKVEVEIKE